MRDEIVAWAGDCMVRGSVDLVDGRLSDQLNEREVVTFFDATLRSLDDGHEVAVGELEVERLELHLIPVQGRRGDPTKRVRTVEERVTLELGPYLVTGNLHRMPTAQALAALTRRTRFVPVTDAIVVLRNRPDDAPMQEEVVLVNLDRIGKTRTLSLVPVMVDDWAEAERGSTGENLPEGVPA
ncbi:MAG: hypothetical protein ACJ778_03185 [Chloroflexota bacterium]